MHHFSRAAARWTNASGKAAKVRLFDGPAVGDPLAPPAPTPPTKRLLGLPRVSVCALWSLEDVRESVDRPTGPDFHEARFATAAG